MDKASRVRVRGPLAEYASGFREELAGRGYATSSAATHLVLMAQLSRWLERSTLDAGELTVQQVEQFRRENRAQGHRFPKSAKGFVPILEYLRAVGAVPVAPARIPTTSEELVGRFGLYLVGERGLAAGTIRGYQDAARLFLADVGFTKERDLALLAPTQVHRFLLAESARRSVASVKCLVSGLKALLCFLYLQGITGASLAGSVPTVAGWSGSSVPRGVDAGCVRRLLNSCDRRSTKGRRDYAILMVLVRLGIRAGEVVALELNDVDWRRGELLIRGKARRLEQLPIPVDVGQAMADYVRRGRPVSEHRGLFLRVLAPHRGLTVGAISVIVHTACDRAGVPPMGTHRLRHTVATELLRRGAGLSEIGQLLRHRSPASSAIYAKADTAALRELARPWPGSVA